MKKRIVSMILALSMMLSILPVSAFADAGAGLSSAAAEETNSITYSSENEHEAVGTNSETKNQVVKIKIGTNGLPKAASGTGWSYDETTGLTITGTGNGDIEYILDGTVSCNVTVKNVSGSIVYLMDGTVTGTLLIEADNAYGMYGVYVLGGSYADAQLNLGTVDGGTYDKLTENGGNVRGGFFRDITGLSTDTQQQAHQLLLPENCTLNGRKETGDIYLIKKYNYSGNGNDLELVVESDTGCNAWAAASTSGSAMTLPAGIQNYSFTNYGTTFATVSISPDGKTLSASFSVVPAQEKAPIKLVPMVFGNAELHFNSEGQPDLTDVTYVDSLDTDTKLRRVYMGNGWAYNCYPNDSSKESIVQILNKGGADFDFSKLSDGPINCYVEITNANVTGGEFGENGRLNIYSGKISGGSFHNVSAGSNSINENGAVEITGGTFDSLYCNGPCSITNAVIQSCNFNTYGGNTYTVSNTVLGELPDGIQKLLADGQQLSTLVVRNGGVTAMNGRTLPLSTNTIYLVGVGSAELTLNTDVLSINDAPVSSYNANTSADGKVLRITGNNDGKDILVNKSTDASALKRLRITEKGLPDLTGVTGVPMSGEGMTITLYEGLGWKYATTEENGVERTAFYVTTPDGNPVDLTSDTINPYHVAIATEEISLANVTVTGIEADGSVNMQNATVESGTFQKDVYMDDNSTIAGGTFQDIVRAYGKVTGGAFNAEVQLNQNSEVTGGVFHDVKLPSYASEETVIRNAMILGSLKTDSGSKAAVSNTVSCGYIESGFLAAGQQQSKLMIMDGTVEAVDSNAVATDTVYLVGNTAVTLTFSTKVTNINGADVGAYNGAQLSEDGKTLTLTAKNDGEPIVVNMTTTGKLPFSSLSKSDFTVSGTIEHQTVTSSKDGVGELSLVYVRTYDGAVFATYPAANELYGLYKQRIVAQEGDKYTDGSLDIGEVVHKYQPKLDDFAYDPETHTAKYNGPMYFDDAPLYSIQYVAEDGSTSVTKPTKAGTYDIYIMVDYSSDHYYGAQYIVDTYTVTEKLPFSSLTKEDFVIDWSTLVPGITCKKEGVGKPSVVFVRTYDNKEFDHFPHPDVYGNYKVYIRAEEGTLYEGGELQIDEAARPYKPTSADFRLDLDAGTATYSGKKYFGDVLPQADLVYSATNDFSTATATVPTKVGTYYVWLVVEGSRYYDGSNDPLPDGYTVAEKLPFEGFKAENFDWAQNEDGTYIQNEDGTYTLICTTAEGVGKLTAKFECITGVNKGKIFTNQEPDAYGRYQGTIVAEEGKKYKAGSIELGEESLPYEPEAADFTYDAATNKVKYTGTNYYDADPTQVTLLYGTNRSETVPTAPGSYDVYVRVDGDENYYNSTTEKVGTYVVPEPTKPKYYWNGQEGMEQNVGDKITLSVDKLEGNNVIWKIEGLADNAYTITDTGTHIELQFFMPSNNVRVTNHYEPIYYTLTVDGKEERRAFGKEVTFTAPEKEGHTFTGWEKEGLPADAKIDGANITFKMPANNVTLTPQYEKNTYTLTVDGKDEPRVFDEDVTVIAQPVEGKTFTGWKVTGLPDDVDTSKATITFKMPANNVTLKAEYTENAPETYELKVTDATVTLKDGGAVADLTAVPVGTELVVTAPEKAGYTFDGWEKDGLPADANIDGATITFTMPANNVTLKAQYTENAPETYELKVTDAQVTLKDGGAVADLTAVPAGTELVATAPEKEGYTFTGWTATGLPANANIDGATVTFKMPANKVTLNAKYIANAPKTYELKVTDAKVTLKDGGAVADLTAVPVDTELVVTAPEKAGYTFDSWEKDGLPADANIDGATIAFKMPANNVTLKAQYTEIVPEKYTVTMGDEVTEYAVDADVSITAPAKVGETFTGWDAVGVPEGTDTTSETISFTMPKNNVTLTPQYEKNTYTLTVDGKDEQRAFDEQVAVTAPKKDGYTFTGWEVTGLPADVDTTKVTISFTMPANNVTLKAQYTENAPEKYTVTMGEEVTEYAVDADVSITAPAKAGETFTGWDAVGVPEGTDTTSETISFKMPANNVTLTPQYKKDSTPTPAPGGDSDGGGAIVMVAAVGGAAIGVGAYVIGTTAYLKSVLPEGMAIPANRQQLAVALWTAAGKPATQSTALFNDVAADAAELQAIRWVVETGLMTAQDGNFKPGSRVSRLEVIRTWKTYQQRG